MRQYRIRKHVPSIATISISFAFISSALADSERAICEKLKNADGLYLVYDSGEIKALTRSSQSAKLENSMSVYVVIADDGSHKERVQHLRILAIASPSDKVSEPEGVSLSRNKIDSRCRNGSFFGKLFGFGPTDWHGKAKIVEYDQHRNPTDRGFSADLNKWHFYWENGKLRQRPCENTADYVPAIRQEKQHFEASTASRNFTLSSAMADTPKYKLPDNTAAISMALIHRPADSTACYKIALTFQGTRDPVATLIDQLQLGKQGKFYKIDQARINWINTP